jgi:hypothetical protein
VTIPRSTARIKSRHEERLNGSRYPDLDDPELAGAYHALQLHWLASVPGYRAEVRERVAEAARKAEKAARRIERTQQDYDGLGRDVEGCG